MVSSEQGDPIRILYLQAEKVLECFHRMIAPINEVSNKDIASLIDLSS